MRLAAAQIVCIDAIGRDRAVHSVGSANAVGSTAPPSRRVGSCPAPRPSRALVMALQAQVEAGAQCMRAGDVREVIYDLIGCDVATVAEAVRERIGRQDRDDRRRPRVQARGDGEIERE